MARKENFTHSELAQTLVINNQQVSVADIISLNPLNLAFADPEWAKAAIMLQYYGGKQPKVNPADMWARYLFDTSAGIAAGNTTLSNILKGNSGETAWSTSWIEENKMSQNNFFLAYGMQIKWFGVPTQADIIILYNTLHALISFETVTANNVVELQTPHDFIPNGYAPYNYTDGLATGATTIAAYGTKEQEAYYGFNGQCLILQQDNPIEIILKRETAIAASALSKDLYFTFRLIGKKISPLG